MAYILPDSSIPNKEQIIGKLRRFNLELVQVKSPVEQGDKVEMPLTVKQEGQIFSAKVVITKGDFDIEIVWPV